MRAALESGGQPAESRVENRRQSPRDQRGRARGLTVELKTESTETATSAPICWVTPPNDEAATRSRREHSNRSRSGETHSSPTNRRQFQRKSRTQPRATADALIALVADLEASLGDSFPVASPEAAELRKEAGRKSTSSTPSRASLPQSWPTGQQLHRSNRIVPTSAQPGPNRLRRSNRRPTQRGSLWSGKHRQQCGGPEARPQPPLLP